MKPTNIISALREVLTQGVVLLSSVEPEIYRQTLPAAFDSSIGGHYRHCLDHFQTLLETKGCLLDYDARPRDPRIEKDREFARICTLRLRDLCSEIPLSRFEDTVLVRSKVSYSCQQPSTVSSTVGREAMYVVAHAIHHYALIGIMGALQNARLPEGFGVAPSTVKYREDQGVLLESVAV
jgi:hypothetical protein